MLKKLSEQRKLLQRSLPDLQSQYFEVQKAAAQAVKMFKEPLMGEVWSSFEFQLLTYRQTSILADHSSLARGKAYVTQPSSRTQIVTSSVMKLYSEISLFMPVLQYLVLPQI